MLSELSQGDMTQGTTGPKAAMLKGFAQYAAPMGQNLVSTLTTEQLDAIGDFLEREAHKLSEARARYREQLEQLGA